LATRSAKTTEITENTERSEAQNHKDTKHTKRRNGSEKRRIGDIPLSGIQETLSDQPVSFILFR